MKQIYLARHAETVEPEYRSVGQLLIDFQTRPDFGDGPLTEHGKEQARILAKAIKETFKPDGNYYLFTSWTKKCVETGNILCEELGIWAGGGHSMWLMPEEIGPGRGRSQADLNAIVEMCENHPYKAYEGKNRFHGVVMVTHHSNILPLAEFIGRKNQFPQIPNISHVQTGQAVYLDLENRTHRMLPQ